VAGIDPAAILISRIDGSARVLHHGVLPPLALSISSDIPLVFRSRPDHGTFAMAAFETSVTTLRISSQVSR
jgi:hypothetical protein